MHAPIVGRLHTNVFGDTPSGIENCIDLYGYFRVSLVLIMPITNTTLYSGGTQITAEGRHIDLVKTAYPVVTRVEVFPKDDVSFKGVGLPSKSSHSKLKTTWFNKSF